MREFIFQLLKKQVYKELKLIRAQNNAAIELDKIEKKLAELLTHAKYNCAYYKKRLLSYPSTSILSELPILTKHELAKYKNEILSFLKERKEIGSVSCVVSRSCTCNTQSVFPYRLQFSRYFF